MAKHETFQKQNIQLNANNIRNIKLVIQKMSIIKNYFFTYNITDIILLFSMMIIYDNGTFANITQQECTKFHKQTQVL